MKSFITTIFIITAFLSCKEGTREAIPIQTEPLAQKEPKTENSIKENDPTIQETKEWILSKLRQYHAYDITKVGGIAGIKETTTKRRFTKFSFLGGELLLSFHEIEKENDGRFELTKREYDATIDIPIGSLKAVVIKKINGTDKCNLEFYSESKNIQWVNHTEKFTEYRTAFGLGFDCNAEPDLEGRLQKAFNFLKTKHNKTFPKNPEPF